MITKFITDVTTTFNPFSPRAKICRVFLAQFGPSAFGTVKFNTRMLPRSSKEPATLKVKFQDGKVLDLDPEKIAMKDITEEINRHSRILTRKADLTDSNK